ncbi:hypothetical protein ACMYQ1_10550 [Shewanella oncorhynchi]|uniref:hypothetical protein n=1 Tax=Shewanella oncorhynchi TaxID=2726434 RepID=UPI0039F04C95
MFGGIIDIKELVHVFSQIKFQQALSLDTYFIILCVSGLGTWLASYFKVKGQNYANKEDFERLKNQLEKNTTVIETVKSDFLRNNTEIVETIKNEQQVKSWVNQQIWVKKQEIYESIFEKLLLVKKNVAYQSNNFQEDLNFEREQEYCWSQGGDSRYSRTLQSDLEKKHKEYTIRVNSPEYIAELKNLRAEKEQAISSLMELASINSVYIDGDVEIILDKLQAVLSQRYDGSDVEEIENQIHDECKAVEKSIADVKEVCKKELKIQT